MISPDTMAGLIWPGLLPHLAGLIHRTAFNYMIIFGCKPSWGRNVHNTYVSAVVGVAA